MKARTARKVINIRFRNLVKYYAAMKQTTGMEDIHHFRVEIKKLRAFLRLAGAIYDKKMTIPPSLKKLFRSAGRLRDLQRHSQTLKHSQEQHNHPVPYLKHINGKIARAKKNLARQMRNRVLDRSQVNIKKEIKNRVSSKSVRKFYYKKLAQIRIAGSFPSITDEDLHTIRKNVKDILYTAKSFEIDLGRNFPLPGWNKKIELYYTKLADELGRFQDCRTDISHFQRSSNKMTAHEKNIFESLLIQKQQSKNDLMHLLTINPL